jgi:translation initiation factor 2B subunit (eIF-2B alpha/beta/delta family)
MPHPIERLRWVARAEGAGASVFAGEAAVALATLGDDRPGLLTGCRRLIDRHPSVGPLWWVAARALAAEAPARECYAAASDLDTDSTGAALAAHLPDDATVTVLGWPEQISDALRRRGDAEVLVVNSRNEGASFVRRLAAGGVEAVEVAEAGLGGAVKESSLLLLEASAFGASGAVCVAGSLAAAAVARALDIDVWVVAGVGRVLPRRLWEAMLVRVDDVGDPWALEDDVVPLDLISAVSGPEGPTDPDAAIKRADCPVVPELLRWGS